MKNTPKQPQKEIVKTEAKQDLSNILVVVESPNKIKTLKKFIGKKYPNADIMATRGHFYELDPKNISKLVVKNYSIRKELKERLRRYPDIVYIATDDDREGEGIAYQVERVIRETARDTGRKLIYTRVVFHSITEKEVLSALEHPHKLNYNRIQAWRLRKIIDYLVGISLSRKSTKEIGIIDNELVSVGRVQSFALKLVEKAHWLAVKYGKPEIKYLYGVKCHGSGYFNMMGRSGNKQESGGKLYKVKSLKKRKIRLNSPSPYNTASMLASAGKQLGMSASSASRTAQKLFEKGLITYPRTDNLFYSEEAMNVIKNFNNDHFVADTGGAHEAIRPTVSYIPRELRSDNEKKLFEMIRNRFLSTMGNPAVIEETKVVVETPRGNSYTGYGYKTIYEGFLRYEPHLAPKLQQIPETVTKGRTLEGKPIIMKKINPPHRPLTDAGVVINMRGNGVGRPSTYAMVIDKMIKRGYVIRRKNRLLLTRLGEDLLKWLQKEYPVLLDKDFTANIEEKLDQIEKTGDRTVSKDLLDTIKSVIKGDYKFTKKYPESFVAKEDKPEYVEGEQFAMAM